MNVSVSKRWNNSHEKSAVGSGAAKKVPYALHRVLREILDAVASKVAVSTSVPQTPVDKELGKLVYGSASPQWVREFMLERDMSLR